MSQWSRCQFFLESTEVEPTQEVLAELERWSRLLEKALGSLPPMKAFSKRLKRP